MCQEFVDQITSWQRAAIQYTMHMEGDCLGTDNYREQPQPLVVRLLCRMCIQQHPFKLVILSTQWIQHFILPITESQLP